MAIFDDRVDLNDAQSTGDWTTVGFDSPTLNNASSTTPFFREDTGCMQWLLKKGQTDDVSPKEFDSRDLRVKNWFSSRFHGG